MASPQMFTNLPLPTPWPGANQRLILGAGAPLDPLVRLGTFSSEEFENFVLQWVHEYLSKKYFQVQQRGGAGDKGRDIIAWIDGPDSKPRRWDNYQCKHYKDTLTPSEFWVELGKLCHYTYQGNYCLPENYYIVTHRGIGPRLADLLDNPIELRNELLTNWGGHCQDKITRYQPVLLTAEFQKYIESINFSLIKSIPPHELIEQHSYTKYHSLIFGTSLKPRPKPKQPPASIAGNETHYIKQIYKAFSDCLKCSIENQLDFQHRTDMVHHFNQARVCFYSAESLKEFTRDNLPDDSYFTDLMEQFLEGLAITLYKQHSDGYQKMVEASEKAIALQIDSNILKNDLRPNDRVGICHQLANEDKIQWVSR